MLLILTWSITLVVEHRPLVSILDKKSLDQIDNPRLQRLKSKIVQSNFYTEWVCCSTHKIPDAFSRAPISQPTIEDQQAETAIEKHVNLIIHQQFAVNSLQTTTHRNDTRLDELRKIARDDNITLSEVASKKDSRRIQKTSHRQQNNYGI